VATEEQHDEHKAAPSLSDRGVARRRLVKVGAGVLLTLEASASLASPVCATPSGSLSGALHNSHTGPATCSGGFGPGYWKKSDRPWPQGLDRATLAFTSVFPVGGSCQMMPAPVDTTPGEGKGNGGGNGKSKDHGGNPHGNPNAPTTPTTPTMPEAPAMVPVPSYQCALLDEVLSPQSYDDNNLGMHMAATYLNICDERVTFLTVEKLQQIWGEVVTTGFYRPTAGVIWSRGELTEYLKSTMQ
jgi:hypothetical protein